MRTIQIIHILADDIRKEADNQEVNLSHRDVCRIQDVVRKRLEAIYDPYIKQEVAILNLFNPEKSNATSNTSATQKRARKE